MSVKDDYLDKVVSSGDKASLLLAQICSKTLQNQSCLKVVSSGMGGLAVLDPQNYLVVVHSTHADPKQIGDVLYAQSLVRRLVIGARNIGAKPIAFTNVIDASTNDLEHIGIVGTSMSQTANEYGLAIMNGELAILGDRVSVSSNISGTMVSFVSRDGFNFRVPKYFHDNGITYAVFDPKGKYIYMNSDGVGTKTEFAERLGNPALSLTDSVAMKIDDAGKLGGVKVEVVSDVVETSDLVYKKPIVDEARRIGKIHNFNYILQFAKLGDRIKAYKNEQGIIALNISGTAVSTIDCDVLKNLPKPKAGEYLIALRGRPTPRSNGITDKRRAMIELFGDDWHKTSDGKRFMEFLSEPSTIFYSLFRDLREKGLGTSFYHMSGGAFDGKLARPLAKHNIFIKINGLFPADWRELAISEMRFTPAETAYAKWPMGNEGFVTTSNPDGAIGLIKAHNLEGKVVGRLESALNGRTGVELEGINASSGGNVYYSGRSG